MNPQPNTSTNNRGRRRITDGYDTDDSIQQAVFDDPDESEDEQSSDDDPDVGTESPIWSNNTIGMRPIPFLKEDTLLTVIPGEGKPMDFFTFMLDDVLLEQIVKFTNNHAFDLYFRPSLTPKSRINKWKDLTVPELKIFLGLLLHTGTVKLNRIQDYWKKDYLFNFKCFREVMSRDRFLAILRCLYFHKPTETPGTKPDPMEKITLVIDTFNNKMITSYYPQKELSLDEAMVLWRGRLRFRQYIKGKRHKYGLKLYTLTEHQGLILQFMVYAGKDDALGGKGHTEKVVLHLMRHYLGKGHALYMDNFYNSYTLASKLLAKETYCTGTLRVNRKHIAPEVKSAILKKGETIARYANSVMIGKWKDKRVVTYISTEHENGMYDFIDQRNRVKKKPLPIIKYNAFMKGVDRADQMLSYYPSERKVMQWYKKLFVHIVQMFLLNAHKLHNMYREKKTLYEFRLEIIRGLLPPPAQSIEGPAQKRLRKSTHIPTKSTVRGANNRLKRKKCRWCWKQGKDVRSVFTCEICPDKPGLCVDPCFQKYHDSL